MKVSKINHWFGKFGAFQIKHRVIFLIVIAALTVFCCAGLPKLKLSNSESDWFEDWEETKINEDHFKDLFDSDDSMAVLVQAKDVFDPEVLKAIKEIGDQLEQNVPYAKSVTSLAKLNLPVGNEEGFEVVNPFEDGIPDTAEEIKAKKDFIMSRESLVNNLVSDDGTETWIMLKLYSYDEDLEEAMYKIVPPAMKILKDDKYKSDKYTLKPIGLSYTEYEEDEALEGECIMRIAIGFLVMIVCLLVFVRSFRGFVVPFIATVFGVCSVLGATGWLGIEGSTMLIVLPVLLAMALSVGYSIHYINSFRMHFRRTGERKASVLMAVEESGWPILFTVITTMASMLSFCTSGIGQVKWVGACTAACVFSVYLYVIILIPIFMSFGKNLPESKIVREEAGATKTDLWFEKLGGKVLDGKWWTVAVSAVIVAVCIPAFAKISVNMDYVKMMGEKTPYVARIIDIMKAKLGSQYDYNVMIEFPEEDAVKSPEVFKRLDELSDILGKLRATKVSGNKPRVTSITSIAKEMNRTMNYDKAEFYKIPEDPDTLNQLLFMYEISGGDDLYDWVDEAYTTTYVHVAMKGYDAEAMSADVKDVKAACKELFPEAKCAVIGTAINFAEMNGKLVRAELKSFTGSFVIILVLMALAFSSIRTGLIGMIPNLAPVVFIGGIMGHCNFYLDMMTMTIMPMILGIAVDDTIHFTNHIKFFFEKTGSYRESIIASYREIGKTMGMTTVILCSMFLVLAFSPITCMGHIGVMSIAGLGSALLADYTLTPVLMYLVKPFGKEKKTQE